MREEDDENGVYFQFRLSTGAMICSEEGSKHMSPGDHGSTFSGSPLTCAAGIYTIDRVSQPRFLEGVSEAGDYLRKKLSAMDGLIDVRFAYSFASCFVFSSLSRFLSLSRLCFVEEEV